MNLINLSIDSGNSVSVGKENGFVARGNHAKSIERFPRIMNAHGGLYQANPSGIAVQWPELSFPAEVDER